MISKTLNDQYLSFVFTKAPINL